MASEVVAERRIEIALSHSAYAKLREMAQQQVQKARHLMRLGQNIGHRPPSSRTRARWPSARSLSGMRTGSARASACRCSGKFRSASPH